ncbi:MAG: hypothetical protein H6719_38270, partial [Sandaracinaceae bacterium]|nr:hypothetical protein [Sandaracinaceae bacterium]
IDTDGDGLCDETEIAWGTNPEAVDSDLDGLTDRAERDLGYAPLLPDSPPRDLLVFLEEAEGATAQYPIQRIVRGNGEVYTGAFVATRVANRLDYDASTFLEQAHAVGAYPMENVFEVLPEAQQFRGVFGRTELTYEIRFAFDGATPRSCVTAFPFSYQIKREDGVTVGFGRYLLVVLPDGGRLENAEWCVPDGGCI